MKTDWEAAHSDGTGQLGPIDEKKQTLVAIDLDFDPEHVRRCYVQALCDLKSKQRPAMDTDILHEMLNMCNREKVWKMKKEWGF